MGSRADLVIRQDGVDLFYKTSWDAESLDVLLFWGPAYARDYIHSNRVWTKEDEWYDDGEAEGGVVLDCDRRHVVFYGGYLSIFQRRPFLALMRQLWAGWTIQYADAGLCDIVGYFSYPYDHLLTWWSTPADDESEGRATFSDRGMSPLWVTLRNRRGDEVKRIIPLPTDVIRFLRLGPIALNLLPYFEAANYLYWDCEDDPRPRGAVGGIDVFTEEKMLSIWHDGECSHDGLAWYWPDWTAKWHGDRYEVQTEQSGGHIVVKPPPLSKVIADLRDKLLQEKPPRNFERGEAVARKIGGTLTASGPDHTPQWPTPVEQTALFDAAVAAAFSDLG